MTLLLADLESDGEPVGVPLQMQTPLAVEPQEMRQHRLLHGVRVALTLNDGRSERVTLDDGLMLTELPALPAICVPVGLGKAEGETLAVPVIEAEMQVHVKGNTCRHSYPPKHGDSVGVGLVLTEGDGVPSQMHTPLEGAPQEARQQRLGQVEMEGEALAEAAALRVGVGVPLQMHTPLADEPQETRQHRLAHGVGVAERVVVCVVERVVVIEVDIEVDCAVAVTASSRRKAARSRREAGATESGEQAEQLRKCAHLTADMFGAAAAAVCAAGELVSAPGAGAAGGAGASRTFIFFFISRGAPAPGARTYVLPPT